jgi:hypothetical protein
MRQLMEEAELLQLAIRVKQVRHISHVLRPAHRVQAGF